MRPIITYAFFILFSTVKTAALFKLLDQGVGITDGLYEEVLGQEQWHGVFEYGSKNLKVIGTLEKD